jgi:hypothetical protein
MSDRDPWHEPIDEGWLLGDDLTPPSLRLRAVAFALALVALGLALLTWRLWR